MQYWIMVIMSKKINLYILYRNVAPEKSHLTGFSLEIINLFSSDGEILFRTMQNEMKFCFENHEHMRQETIALAAKQSISQIFYLNVQDFNMALDQIKEKAQIINIFLENADLYSLNSEELKGKGLFSRLFE